MSFEINNMADNGDFESLIRAMAAVATERGSAEITISIYGDGSGYFSTDEPLSTQKFRGPHSFAVLMKEFISENAN